MPVNSFDNYPMNWKPDLSKTAGPKYKALVKLLEEDIKNGTLKAGTKLPPQRELADFLDVNLSTISKAYKLCEQKGLISAAVGSGTYVSSDAATDPVFLCETDNTPIIKMGAIVPFVTSNQKVEHRLLGKGKANRQKSSIHAGLRRDGSQKLTSQKTDYCTITYRF